MPGYPEWSTQAPGGSYTRVKREEPGYAGADYIKFEDDDDAGAMIHDIQRKYRRMHM